MITTKGETYAITVGNSISRNRGSLEIKKTVSNPDGATLPASFLVDYDCGVGYTGQVSVAPGAPATVGGIPTGSTCTLVEVAPSVVPGFTWGTITYTPASQVITTKGETYAITVGNSISRNRGSLEIKKTVSNPDGATLPASFLVDYDCGVGYTGQVSVAPGAPATVGGIPTGSTCTLVEVAPSVVPGFTWGTITYTPASQVITTKGETYAITVGNSISRNRGSLEIKKTVSNPDGATLPASFLVDYDCGVGYTGQVSVAPGAPATVGGIPTGSTCTLVEVAPSVVPGFTWGTITYTPASQVITTKGETYAITVGNSISRNRGSLEIKKTVSNPDGATLPASFLVDYDCGVGYTGQVSVAPGAPATVGGIPTGSTCTLVEVAPSVVPGFTWGTITYTPASQVITTKGETYAITVGNSISRNRGSLEIKKTVSNPDGATLPASFLVDYDCGVGYTGQVSVAPGAPATVGGIPTGSTCTLVEVAPSVVPGFTWGTITYTPASQVITTKGETYAITVGNSISRNRGSLEIKKTVSNPDGATLPASFLVDYDCGVGYTGQVSVAPGAPATVGGIPTGSTCTLVEVAPSVVPGFTWGTITYTPASQVITTKGETYAITVGNSISRNRGSLEIKKTVSNPDGATLPASFLVDYDCGVGYTGQVSVAPGAPATVGGIPTGSTCTLVEVAPSVVPGFTWGTITYTPASQVITTKGETYAITVGNSISRNRGSLEIKKTLNDGGSGYDEPFAIDYVCELEGDDNISGSVDVAAGGSAVVGDIPSGYVCTVTETLPGSIAGYTWSVPVITGSPTTPISKDGTAVVTVANSLSKVPPPPVDPDSGALSIAKTLAGGPTGYGAAFAIDYSCVKGSSVISGTVSVTAGGSETVYNIPNGYVCTVTESLPAPPSGYTWSTPVITGSPTGAIAGGSTVTVSVANTLNEVVEPEIPPVVLPGVVTPPPGTVPVPTTPVLPGSVPAGGGGSTGQLPLGVLGLLLLVGIAGVAATAAGWRASREE